MLEVIKSAVLILSTLFPILNPLGTSPIFLAMTKDYPSAARALSCALATRRGSPRISNRARSLTRARGTRSFQSSREIG